MIENVVSLFSHRPVLGYGSGIVGGIAGISAYLNLISGVIGLLAATCGLAAGLFTALIKYREWKNPDKK